MELVGTKIFKKTIESLIKTHYNTPKDNQFLNGFDKGMDLNSFETSFKNFQEESKCPSTSPMMKNCKPLSNLKNIQ